MVEQQLEVLRRLASAALQGDIAEISLASEQLAGLDVSDDLGATELAQLQQATARAMELLRAARSGVTATRLMLEDHLFADCLFTYGPDGQLLRHGPQGRVVARL